MIHNPLEQKGFEIKLETNNLISQKSFNFISPIPFTPLIPHIPPIPPLIPLIRHMPPIPSIPLIPLIIFVLFLSFLPFRRYSLEQSWSKTFARLRYHRISLALKLGETSLRLKRVCE